MEKGTVRHRILVSNVWMVLVTLVVFLGINVFIIFCYSESIEDEVKAAIEKVLEPGEIDALLKDYTIYRNEFIMLFMADGLLCIAVLIIVSQYFTRNLTGHIMKPLDELAEGTKRIKANELSKEITYEGDREFEEVCNSFNEMMKAISAEQEKNKKYEKARTDMIAGISHDLRTPLTAVKGTIKGLIDGVAAQPEQQKRFLETAYRRTCDMELLLNQLFYLSKLETGNMPVSLQKTDISSFLRAYADSKGGHTGDDGPLVKVSIEAEGEYIAVDTEQLHRILDNLLENSRKYSGAAPVIVDIHLYKTEKECCICVKDNGVGVPAEKMPYIFDEFYRADESRNKNEGNGLGLYIVKCLMEGMGGSVSAEGTDGFSVYLHFPLTDNGEEHG